MSVRLEKRVGAMTPLAFRCWVNACGFTLEEAAEHLDYSASQVHNLVKGEDRSGKPAPIRRSVALACAAIYHRLEPWTYETWPDRSCQSRPDHMTPDAFRCWASACGFETHAEAAEPIGYTQTQIIYMLRGRDGNGNPVRIRRVLSLACAAVYHRLKPWTHETSPD